MIVGIAGKKRAGKDTMANEFTSFGYRRMSFATPIRDFVEGIIGDEITDGNKEQEISWIGNGASPQLCGAERGQ